MSQTDEILTALRSGERLTPRYALARFGCSRLAARIWELERAGHHITTRMVKVPGRHGETCLVAEYSMTPAGELFAPAFDWETA